MHFVARYPNATQAKAFAENAARVIGGAQDVTRVGRVVEFNAPILDSDGYPQWGDIQLSVGAYGGPGTTLNGQSTPREY